MSDEAEDFAGEPDPFDPLVARRAEDEAYENVVSQDDSVKGYIRTKRRAYLEVFSEGPTSAWAVQYVLQDLAMFSRAYETRYHAEDKKQNMLEGRAEVFYRIKSYTRLDNDTLFLLLTDAKTKMER